MDITLIAVPFQMDVARWGYALGPQAWLDAGIGPALESQGHRVRPAPVWIDLPRAERTRDTVTNLARIAARTSAAVRDALAAPAGFALVLEGDCTHAVGAIGGLAQATGAAPGVVWFDAHGDLHTMATTTSGYIGGMPYAVALGWEFDDWRSAAGLRVPVAATAAALFGTSDLDDAELVALDRQPIAHLTAGALTPVAVTATLAARATAAAAWYLHVDVDVAGPDAAPGGMTPAPAWPDRATLIASIAAAAQTVPVRVLGLATYNPAGDPARRGARLGRDMLAAALSAG